MTMENLKTLFKSIILALVATITASCSVLQNAIEKPTVHVQEVKYHPVSVREGRLDSRMQIRNPNSFALPVRNVTYHLKLNGRVFADSKLSFDKNIPAKGMIELQVPIQFQYGELLQGITSMIMNRDIQFQLAGKLDLGLVEVPFSKTGEFALKY